MKFIYILEDDERVQKDLFETLKSIDPQLHIRFFNSLAPFHKFLTSIITDGSQALPQHGTKHALDASDEAPPSTDHELRLVIAKYEFFGKQNLNLIKRARDFFLRKKVCSASDPTSLILTAFDSPEFDISLAEQRIVNNVLYKPFDKLILKLHLEYALTGHHPISTDTVVPMQVNSTLEMLKDVTLNSLSEVGFTTLNNHEIKAGAFTKYYSEAFKTDDKRSVYASCTSCKEVGPQKYLCDFQFFGIDNKQVAHIRRTILQNKDHLSLQTLNTHGAAAQILLLEEDSQSASDLKTLLEEKFSNASIYIYNSMGQFLSDLADKETAKRQTLPARFDLVLANYEIFSADKEKRWEQFAQAFKERAQAHRVQFETPPPLILMTKRKMGMDEIREISAWSQEIFFLPLDRNYFIRKLIAGYKNLTNRQTVQIATHADNRVLNVANPVKVTQISEGGLILKYYREISIGAFREFILWRPKDLENPEIVGTVNFTEKDKSDPNSYLIHFVFFGMKDYYLKHIRLWLLDSYIKTKDKETA